MASHPKIMADKILRGVIAVSSLMTQCGKDFNNNGKNNLPISLSQFQILHCMDSLQFHSIAEAHTFLKLSESTLSILISKLVDDGYLRKEHPKENEDGRKKYFYITELGTEMLRLAENMMLSQFSAYYDGLSAQQKDYLRQGIQKMHAVFDSLENNKLEAK